MTKIDWTKGVRKIPVPKRKLKVDHVTGKYAKGCGRFVVKGKHLIVWEEPK
jgi:hypothetical protein